MRRSRSMRRRIDGFSLLELILVIAIVSVLAGAAVPVVAVVITRQKVDETRKEMRALVPAIQSFWWDCRRFPATLEALQSNRPAVSGWKGPYTTALLAGQPGVNLSLTHDAWNQPYVLTHGDARTYNPVAATNRITIRSKGPDLVASTADDLTQVVDVVFLRRKETIEELTILNAAIQAYNARYLATDPLPTNANRMFTKLYDTGLLPRPPRRTTDPLRTDGWGASYVPSPANVAPVVRVVSSNVGSAGTPPIEE